ncbi:MAG: aspartate kinase [Flavobacteriales bacterium]|jgi:aspartate kinase|nr:aspartate kinase [Flavobacteriales bacterium]
MIVFKFGGASVKNTEALKNAVNITKTFEGPLVIVVSAMGKTTNSLEELWAAYLIKDVKGVEHTLDKLYKFHAGLIADIGNETQRCNDVFSESFNELKRQLTKEPSEHKAFEYDQIVSFGELWATLIFSEALKISNVNCRWIDARKTIRTSNHYQNARVDWLKTKALVNDRIITRFKQNSSLACIVTQGFIGHTNTGMTTTLGREGSDFSAAILAWALEAKEVFIWKDVPGLLNADPKEFDGPLKIDKISYKEAIELSYFGASVIHPKTLKPLQNKNIPLRIKSFIDPESSGTIIQSDESSDANQPSYIYNKNQLLISISPKDFSFIMEDHISEIFNLFSKNGLKVHLMQNSALNFSVCANMKKAMLKNLIEELSENFNVKYNENVDLLTIRQYENHVFPEKLKKKNILIKQRTRSTLRYVLN